jgi:hypothetical protein
MRPLHYFKSKVAIWLIIIAVTYLIVTGLSAVDEWQQVQFTFPDPDKAFRAYVAIVGRALIDSVFLFGTAIMVEYLYRIGVLLQRINKKQDAKSLFEDSKESEK